MKLPNVFVFLVVVLTYLGLGFYPEASAQTRAEGRLIIRPNDGFDFNFGSVALNETLVAVIQVGNPTDHEMTSLFGSLMNPHFRFKGRAYPGDGGTCAKTLASMQVCTIVLEFNPQSVGEKRGVVRLNYWEGPTAPRTSYRPITGRAD